MNRPIEFRGKRIDNGEWVYGYYVRFGFIGREKNYIIPSYASNLYAIEVDSSTIGQFTGLVDKNGKRIYEGDLVRQFADCDEYGTELYYKMLINFDEESVAFYGANITCNGVDYSDKYYGSDLSSLEVIGNIHDKENK